MASEKAFCTMTSILGGSDEIAFSELSDEDTEVPEGRIDDNAEDNLLFTTEDMMVNANMPPKHRKNDTSEVTIARYCIIRACEWS